ncbi:MAG TPA: F0F1 ATP synthase subunit A [Patescibacteria group bacterium]|nr:F0F1 ATP synthase subunit A [Patescibacteria group bacterium]
MAELAAETIFHIGTLPVTNTFINTLLVDGVLIGSTIALNKKLKKIPGMFQNIIEYVFATFYSFIAEITGKHVKVIFPFVVSFFLFILVSNWGGLLPGVGTIGFFEGEGKERHLIPLFRNATSDVNVTFALALISLVVTHILSVKTVGIKDYLSRYFSLNPIMLFVGILEIVSEITKIISLSFRLYGNIFAGEVVLVTVSSLFAFLVPIPFMLLEIIVGLVQALVFSILTMVFMSILMTPHHTEAHVKGENGKY